jgi:hypothetical protein
MEFEEVSQQVDHLGSEKYPFIELTVDGKPIF